MSGLAEGVEPTRVFRFWTGDDTDASVVIDDEGFLYVGVENERGNQRAAEVGQLVKLDPRQPDNPLVWSVQGPRRVLDHAGPARRHRHRRRPTAAPSTRVDRQTGAIRWTFELPGPPGSRR